MSNAWRHSFAIYLDRRILTILLLGFASGLPLALTGATLAVRLTEAGISLATIGLFALVGLPYSTKFLWAPVIDRARLPILSKRFGRRRGWLLLIQTALILCLLGLGAVDPVYSPVATAALALAVAFFSASQDVVIDAYRVEILDEARYGAGAASVQFGYRLAMLTSGAGALFLADLLPWGQVYALMAGLMALGVVVTLVSREPFSPPSSIHTAKTVSAWTKDAFIGPFADMIKRHSWGVVAILAFVIFYKLGDALAGVMANPFYIKMGFSKTEIAEISKLYGFIATLIGTALGGVLVARMGIFKSLLFCGLLQAGSNVMFAWQATIGHDVWALTATITVENLSGGLGSAAFVAYISRLCSLSYTGTQYALLSSLAAFGRTFLASQAGFLVESLGWKEFFLFSTLAAIPGLLLLLIIAKRSDQKSSAHGLISPVNTP